MAQIETHDDMEGGETGAEINPKHFPQANLLLGVEKNEIVGSNEI